MGGEGPGGGHHYRGHGHGHHHGHGPIGAGLVTAVKADEGVPQNLVTAMKLGLTAARVATAARAQWSPSA